MKARVVVLQNRALPRTSMHGLTKKTQYVVEDYLGNTMKMFDEEVMAHSYKMNHPAAVAVKKMNLLVQKGE
jgi:hypothetical protein